MRTKAVLIALFTSLILVSSVLADEVFFPRRPGISPDGSTVVFSFQGDLWSVSSKGGDAIRLTANQGYDRNPVFSNDGTMIAFASDREGNYDVYVMPAKGGMPTRLTYAATGDYPQAWSKDNRHVLFSSVRTTKYPMDRSIMSVPVAGGTPEFFTEFFADDITPEIPGKGYLFSYGDNRMGRKGYRGTLQSDIWLWDGTKNDPLQVTTHNGYDTDPMWGTNGEWVYYRSDDNPDTTDKEFNIFKIKPDKSGKARLTNFKNEGVRNAKISADGRFIVMEAEFSLFLLDTQAAKPEAKKININVRADQIDNPEFEKTYSNGADELAVSSDGEEYAMIIEGEIVLINKELGGRATVAIPNPARESGIEFKPGSKDTLVFVTDRANGKIKFANSRIALLVPKDKDAGTLREAREHKIIYLTKGKEDCFNPRWSPKGDKIAYTKGKGDIRIMDADGKNDHLVHASWSYGTDFRWSPDGRYLAYFREDNNYNNDIWILSLEDKNAKPINISQHPDEDINPVWSEDGSMIAWSTRRHGNQFDVYYTYLKREDDERTKEEWELWEKTRDKKKDKDKDKDKDKGKDDDKEEEFKIQIDFEDIHLRGRRATSLPGDEFPVLIHPKGDKIYFVTTIEGKNDLYAVNRFGKDQESITSGGAKPRHIQFDEKAKNIYYLTRGVPASVKAGGGKAEKAKFKARLTLNRNDLREQVMNEAWGSLNKGFYAHDMHGLDWKKQRETFMKYAGKVSHDDDFADLMNMMLRPLNASHMGYYPSGRRGWINTGGYLGVVFDDNAKGKNLVVKSVIPHSPADKVKTKIEPGDVIVSVDGKPVSRNENYYRALVNRVDEPILVEVKKKGGKTVEYEMTPMNFYSLRDLMYDKMTIDNRKIVESATNGKVGYVHIQSMGMAGVETFERDLYAAANGKDGLIIDVRDNGGGWTTDMLLTILTQPIHAYTIGRDGEIGYPQPRYPLYRWRKPITVICNEGSYSNAEIFSHAIKTTDRGPVVGQTTGGNVISTWGTTVMDGGHVRLPMRGWFVWGDMKNKDRNHLNQEHNGAVPDYIVVNKPGDMLNGRDPQLKKAIEVIQDEIKDYPIQQLPKTSKHLKK